MPFGGWSPDVLRPRLLRNGTERKTRSSEWATRSCSARGEGRVAFSTSRRLKERKDMMTKTERQAARARCQFASPGPWHAHGNNVTRMIAPKSDEIIAECGGSNYSEYDATFIAAVRIDLPAALDDIDAWRARVRAWSERLERRYEANDAVAAEMRAALDPPEREEQAI